MRNILFRFIGGRVNNQLQAVIFNIARCSLHDGSGLRTVVYFKGCGMRCKWCHNPESWAAEPELLFYSDKCIGCGRCLEHCPQGVHYSNGKSHLLDRSKCVLCGKCADLCPSGALELCGRRMTVEDVLQEILKDRHFYIRSGGGVTFSGGECLLWPEFMQEMMKACIKENINIAIETALNVGWERVYAASQYAHSFFCDIKHPDSRIHKRLTGVGNELILDNLKRLSEVHNDITVRVPLIPGINDGDEVLTEIAHIVNELRGVRGIELLKYNNLALGKGRALGRKLPGFGEPQIEEFMDRKRAVVREALSKDKAVL